MPSFTSATSTIRGRRRSVATTFRCLLIKCFADRILRCRFLHLLATMTCIAVELAITLLFDELNAQPHRQPASYFCLRTADQAWQFLAMDTGCHDNNPITVTDAVTFVEEDELRWHLERIQEFPGRTILLSHQAFFGLFFNWPAAQDGTRQATNPKLLDAFTQLAAKGRIAGWFWGHEHTLSIYKAFAGLERGRCLGHGGVPVSLEDEIYKPVDGLALVPEVVDDKRLGAQGGVYAHGFAIIDLDLESAKVTYFQDINDKAAEMFSETIS